MFLCPRTGNNNRPFLFSKLLKIKKWRFIISLFFISHNLFCVCSNKKEIMFIYSLCKLLLIYPLCVSIILFRILGYCHWYVVHTHENITLFCLFMSCECVCLCLCLCRSVSVSVCVCVC